MTPKQDPKPKRNRKNKRVETGIWKTTYGKYLALYRSEGIIQNQLEDSFGAFQLQDIHQDDEDRVRRAALPNSSSGARPCSRNPMRSRIDRAGSFTTATSVGESCSSLDRACTLMRASPCDPAATRATWTPGLAPPGPT